LSYDPLNPEHEAIGRVHWVKSTICVNILLYTWGLKILESYEIILASFVTIYDILQRLIATRYFDSTIYGSKEPDKILMHIPRNHDLFPWSIHKI
jgi:hypothetical protein